MGMVTNLCEGERLIEMDRKSYLGYILSNHVLENAGEREYSYCEELI